MRRVFIFLFLFFNIVNASFIKEVQFLEVEDKSLKIKDIKNSKQFKKTTLPIVKKSRNNIFVKISFDKSVKLKQRTVLELDNKFNETILEEFVEYEEFYFIKYLTFEKESQPNTLYVQIENEDDFIDFDLKIYKKSFYEKNNSRLNQIFGIAYGIIFSTSLFYFAFFIFNREKMYLYYSITQLSILVILVSSSLKESQLFHTLFELFFLLFLLCFNFFTREFLNTKKNAPILDKIIIFTLFIFVIEFLLVHVFDLYLDGSLEKYFDLYFDSYLSTSAFLLFYLFAALKAYKKGQKEALFYLVGWGVVVLSVFTLEYKTIFSLIDFPDPIFIIHFTTPIESIILAFALSYRMKLITQEKDRQKQLAIQQNKLASMGEMLANIAHQWRQPLTHLSYIMMNLEARYEQDKLTKEYFKKKSLDASKQLEFMSNTINSFRDFFKPSKEKEEFSIVQMMNETITLLESTFYSNEITIEKKYLEDAVLTSYKGQLSQVIFNILNNANDAFIQKKIQNPKIQIEILQIKEKVQITILDNAGGIESAIVDKIFEPYFSTKQNGLGIGLYMSKMIVQKSLNGTLKVENRGDGTAFIITLPLP